ncbi:uncharacterized protein AMSG_10492 [Thecamonas trahens ATCC 50062]|uniref:Uncharacterized protein n=1 Tax=Thecamonas trahens ATCC 50062 TaxID=461836 RepID=A0A0L0DQA3_THETB|nr:hypothetical protein AMSG_10492 [Thecamonas trahens ATCC 50062]KNC54494.1 hypothetical protein AMSG_10492 [Thecamonas trahens ATCC 50062]|eukprot:XP_013753647.1 hypothetical protein AMSG_10492 [Thecamonas trahens ATCC 50062]
MATELDHNIAAALLREQCALTCNPSRYMQRLMRGARGKGKHYEKMAQFKVACMAGCTLAARPSSYMTEDSLKAVLDIASPDNDAIVYNGEETDAIQAQMNKIIHAMREGCYEVCSVSCDVSEELRGSTEPHKCARACASGCDAYFDHVAN